MSRSKQRNKAELIWDNKNGVHYEKRIIVEYDQSDLTVTLEASTKGSKDSDGSYSRTFTWGRFVELMDGIKGGEPDEPGREFVKSVFVGGRSGLSPVGKQGSITDDNQIIAKLPTDDRFDEPGESLLVFYQTKKADARISIRCAQSDNSPAGKDEYYCWQVIDEELQKLLVEDPPTEPNENATEGFSREFREALFLNPRHQRVIEIL